MGLAYRVQLGLGWSSPVPAGWPSHCPSPQAAAAPSSPGPALRSKATGGRIGTSSWTDTRRTGSGASQELGGSQIKGGPTDVLRVPCPCSPLASPAGGPCSLNLECPGLEWRPAQATGCVAPAPVSSRCSGHRPWLCAGGSLRLISTPTGSPASSPGANVKTLFFEQFGNTRALLLAAHAASSRPLTDGASAGQLVLCSVCCPIPSVSPRFPPSSSPSPFPLIQLGVSR